MGWEHGYRQHVLEGEPPLLRHERSESKGMKDVGTFALTFGHQ
jgi:hypothetical protein